MGQIIKQLAEQEKAEDLQALQEVLETNERSAGHITNHQLVQALKEEGFTVAFASVRQHRRKQCRCFVSVYLNDTSQGESR